MYLGVYVQKFALVGGTSRRRVFPLQERIFAYSQVFVEYYINITFPERVIVENIIPRNVIINRDAA